MPNVKKYTLYKDIRKELKMKVMNIYTLLEPDFTNTHVCDSVCKLYIYI